MRLPLYGWLTSNAISFVGTRLSMLALPWFVLETTGSPTKTGLIALFELAPLVAMKIFGGPLIDRLGKRRVSITCDLASTFVVGLIPLLYATGRLHFAALLVLVAAAGALRGPGDDAKSSMIPELVASAGVPTERVTGLHSVVERTASMFGAAAAGVLIGVVGAANAIAIDAVSFALCAVVLATTTARLPRPAGSAATAEAKDPTPYLGQLAAGWRYLRGDRVLLGIAIMVAFTNLIDAAASSVLMPLWAQTHASAQTLGLLFAVMGGCSAIGSAIAATVGARMRRYPTYLVSFLITGLPRFAVIALGAPLWVIFPVFAVAGVFSGFLNPIIGAIKFERIPAPLVGRVTSLIAAGAWGLMPLGGLLGGTLVSTIGLAGAFTILGVAYFMVTMFPAIDPTWKQIDRRPEPEPAASRLPAAAES